MADFLATVGDFFNDIFTNLLNFLWDLLELLIHLLFGWINIPVFPAELKNSINSFLDLIFDNLSLLGFFVRPITLKIIIPLLIIVINFKYIYKFSMWLIKKIPFLSLK